MNPIRNVGLRRAKALQYDAWQRYVGIALAAKSVATFAEGTLTPYASGAYEYQSNPFYEWGGAQTEVPAPSDHLRKLTAGMDARFAWSLQSIALDAELRRIDYHELTYLSHNEETLGGSLQWAFTSLVSGGVELRHDHHMVPFSELSPGDRELLLETENWGSASLNVQTLAGWRFETRAKVRKLDSPRPGLPELNLRENSLHEAIRRTFSLLSAGLDAEYLTGSYTGAGQSGAPSYHQTTLQLAGEHAIKGLSSFEGAIGYTSRTESTGGGASAVTGTLGYKREFTGKTSGEVLLTRAVNSYVTSTGSEIDTGGSLRVTWQATTKLQLVPSFTLTYSDYPGGSGIVRHDRYDVVSLDIHYQVLGWLSLHPYGRYDVRTSNVPSYGFNASAVGVELLFKEAK
jgi:hypothetical protein